MATTRSHNKDEPKKPEDMSAPFFDVQELAYLMKCSVRTILRRIADGYPHSRKGTGPILVSSQDLQVWYELDRAGVQPIRQKRRVSRKPAPAIAA